MAGSKAFLPKDLQGRLPRMIEELAGRITATIFTAILFSMLFLFIKFHNGWLYFVPSAVGPLLAALFLMARPFNPYQSIYAHYEGMEALDVRGDASAKRLVTLLKSRKANWVLLRTGVLISTSLSGITWAVSSLVPGPLNWSFNAGAVLTFTLVVGLFSAGLHGHFLLRWAFRVWTATSHK